MVNKIITWILIAMLTFSCSEGDIIDTNVNFEAQIQSCGNNSTGIFVFYKIDNSSNQLLSFSFSSTSFSLEKNFEEPVDVVLNNTTNKLLYRKLNSQIKGEQYFCSSIPPAENNVVEELVSENGTATISYEKVTGTDNEYIRTILLKNITLVGNGISLRKEIFELGAESFSANQ